MVGDLLTLTGARHGRYEVETASGSTYELDLDGAAMRRIRTDGDPYHELRRDGDTVRLIEVVVCELGRPMTLLIDLQVEGAWRTTRVTTDVLEIRRRHI